MKSFCATLAIWLALVVPAFGTPVIVVGNHDLQPNLAGQTILIFVSGGDAVQGINFNVQVGDGGVATGGTDTGPIIEDVDLLSGIFAGNHTDQTDGPSPLLWNSTTTTDSGSVDADGLLVVLTISTVGLGPGESATLSLTPANEYGGATDFAGIAAEITNGSITVIPEPATLFLAVAGSVTIAFATRRSLNSTIRDG